MGEANSAALDVDDLCRDSRLQPGPCLFIVEHRSQYRHRRVGHGGSAYQRVQGLLGERADPLAKQLLDAGRDRQWVSRLHPPAPPLKGPRDLESEEGVALDELVEAAQDRPG
jgi:hypothetical protein